MKYIISLIIIILLISSCSKTEEAVVNSSVQLVGDYQGIKGGSRIFSCYNGGYSVTNYPDTLVGFGVCSAAANKLYVPDGTEMELVCQDENYYKYEKQESNSSGYDSTEKIWTLEFFTEIDSLSYSYNSTYRDSYNINSEYINFNGTK